MPIVRAPLLALAFAVLLAACAVGPAPSGLVTSPTADTSASESPGEGPGEASPTEAPAETPVEPPTEPPTETPTEPPTEAVPTGSPAGPTPSAVAAGPDACSGTDDNRQFLAAIANAVDWPVVCAVVPRRWHVAEGRYRTGNGGWMYITYAGPGGTSLGLYEGAYCATHGDCPALGAELGPAALGPLEGTLHEIAGGYAVAVDAGSSPSWLMTTTGLDQATTLELAARAAEVGG